jgi:hypothetical protein
MTSFAVDEEQGESCFGDKTDVVFLHRGTLATRATFAQYSRRLYVLVEPGRRHWEPSTMPQWWPRDLGLVHLPNDIFADPLTHTLGLSSKEPIWATTGTLAVWTMSTLFPQAQLLVTGFSIVDNPRQTRLAHARGPSVPLTDEHRLDRESCLLRRMDESGQILVLP